MCGTNKIPCLQNSFASSKAMDESNDQLGTHQFNVLHNDLNT